MADRQPDQRFGVQLACSLAAEPQSGSDLAIAGGAVAVQAIAGGNDVLQSSGQTPHQPVQFLVHGCRFPHQRWVGCFG